MIILQRPGPAFEIFAIEDRFKTRRVGVPEQFIRFFRTDLAQEKIAPADLAPVGLELKRSFGWHRRLPIVIILHERAVDSLLLIEPDPDSRAGHDDPKMVPFAEWFVRFHERIFARRTRAVVPQRA